MKRLLASILSLILCLSLGDFTAAEEAAGTKLLWQGSDTVDTAWTITASPIPTTNAGGTLFMDDLKAGGSFIVTASAGEIYLAYNEWTSGIWAQWYPERCDLNEDGTYACRFSYDAGLLAYEEAGGKDILGVQQLHMSTAASTGPITFYRLEWQAPIQTAASQTDETVLWQGELDIPTAWTLGLQLNTVNQDGDLDPAVFDREGRIEVTSTSPALYLALSEWADGIWAQWYPAEEKQNEDGSYTVIFTFEAAKAAYQAAGGKEIAGVQQLCLGAGQSEGNVHITAITLFTPKEETAMSNEEITVFRGSAYASEKGASLMYNIFTKHAGGHFDAAQMNPGCAFSLTYTGEKNGLYLVLLSHSGATHWAPLTQDSVTENEDGSYTALYSYNTIVKSYGTNFTRLDEIRAVCNVNSLMTCKKITYLPGEGAPADTGDGHWSKPSEGIAFIGDSITQNVYFNEGDFNTLLGREDCVNFGIGGQTSRHLLARIDEVADRSFSRLVIWCGINDIGAGISAEETFQNITAMMDIMREKNPGITFISLSVLPTTTAFYPNEQDKIIARNDLLRAYADAHEDVTFVDAYADFIGEDGYCKDGLTLDGLHPNSAGYQLVKARLLPVLE